MARTHRNTVAKRPIRPFSLKSPEKAITSSMDDPLLPCIRSIRDASDEYRRDPDASAPHFISLLEDCIRRFSSDDRYRDDPRFLKIWILYADAVQDFERVFRMLEVKGICQTHSLLYEAYAIFLVAKGKLLEAHDICMLGISRNVEPRDRLKKMHNLFLNHVGSIVEKAAPSSPKADAVQDFESVFRMLEVKGICQTHSLLYGAYAIYLVAKGKLLEAHDICMLGISRNAEPQDRLKKMHNLFLNHVGSIVEKAAPSSPKGNLWDANSSPNHTGLLHSIRTLKLGRNEVEMVDQ